MTNRGIRNGTLRCFFKKPGLVPGEILEACAEGYVSRILLISRTVCTRQIYHHQNHKFSELSNCYPVDKPQTTVSRVKTEMCIGVTTKNQTRRKIPHSMQWPLMWRTAQGLCEVKLTESEMQKMVWDNEECDRGPCGAEPDMCRNMWKTFTGLKAMISESSKIQKNHRTHYHFGGWWMCCEK